MAEPRQTGHFDAMPNIKQQERRVHTSARQRLENLRWRSAAKTLSRRLTRAVEDGDAEEIADEHRALIKALDTAAAMRAIHPNKAARKKAQAARLVGKS
jgi:small subunit ribosomal protein S20